MWKMIWPVAVAVLSNVFYNISQKSTPNGINAFCALMTTYVVAAIISGILFICTSGVDNVAGEIHKLNWASFVLGLAIVGLEIGFIFLYRVGWPISIGPFVCNTTLCLVLLVVGYFFYHELISIKQLIGMILCIGGLILITT